MKKDTKLLLGLGAALALCAAGYLALRAWNAGAEGRATQAKTLVADLDNVTGLAWERAGESFSFQKESGLWVDAEDPAFPADQDKLEAIAQALSPLEAVRAFPDPDALADYGLDRPAYTLTAYTADGGKTTLALGDRYEGDYYAKAGWDGAVYTVSSALAGLLDQARTDLAALPDLPAASADTLDAVEVAKAGATVRLIRDGEGWTVNGQAVPEDSAALSALLTALGSPRFTGCQAYRPDGDTVAACGLDGPAVVTVTLDEDSYTLSIGARDGDGGDYFARLGEDQTIYRLDAYLAGTLLELGSDSLTAE